MALNESIRCLIDEHELVHTVSKIQAVIPENAAVFGMTKFVVMPCAQMKVGLD